MISGGALLSPTEASLILFGVFFTLMALRVPIAFALGLACLPILVIEPRLSPLVLFIPGFFITMAQGLALPFGQAAAMAVNPRLAGTASPTLGTSGIAAGISAGQRRGAVHR